MAHVNNHQVRFRPVGAMSVIALVSLLALSACAGDDEDSAGVDPASIDRTAAPPGADEQPEAATADTVAGAASDDGAVSTGGAAGTGASTLDPAAGRLLIVDVTVALEVPDAGVALPEVIEIAGRHDGLVYGSDITLDRDAAGNDDSRGTVTIKLPPAAVEPAIADVAALGDLVGRYQSSDDVTDRVTDVETRIISAQQSVDRVQQMLAAATDLGEVVMLEGELTARQLVLEELLAAQRNLRNGTELATLTVDLSTAPVPTDEPDATDDADDADDRSIGDAFATGGRAFLTAITAALIFLGYVAPFLAVALVVALVARAVIRRRPARRRSAPLPSPTTPPPAPVAPAADDRAAEPVS